MKITLDNDGITCACYPGHRCRACKHRSRLNLLLIIHKWMDDPTRAGRTRDEMTWAQQIDARDRAWTARDLNSVYIYIDRTRIPRTWWEARWPEYWSRQSTVRDTPPAPSREDRDGWATWMREHDQPIPGDDLALDLFAVTGVTT